MIKDLFLALRRVIVAGSSRSEKAKKNIIGSLILKGGTIMIGIFLIPITINYVNPTQYGIWLTLSSVMAWFGFFDIGFGQGLRNKLVEAVAVGDDELGKVLVSTTYAILVIIMGCIVVLFFFINSYLDWSKILSAPDQMAGSLSILALTVLGFVSVQLILQLINTVAFANQEPVITSLNSFLGNALALLAIGLLVEFTTGNLLYLGFALSGAPVIVLILSSVVLYATKYRRYAPALNKVDFSHYGELASLGLKFFILQIGAVILFQTNVIIINQLFGPLEVTKYSIAFKYFGAVFMLFGIIISPLWSAFTDAWIKDDTFWVKNTLRKLKRIYGFFVVGLVIMLIISNEVYRFLVAESVIIPFTLSLIVAVSIALQIWQSIFLQFLNGISKVMLQLYVVIVISVVNIPLAIQLGNLFGTAGVVLSSVILFFVVGLVMYLQTEKILNKTAHGIWNR
jgi:O-antigen/teichoic acid export membrane protein